MDDVTTRSVGPGTLRHAARVLLAALLVAAVCTAAGLWQWSRHETRSAAIALVERNYGAQPAPLEDVLDGTAVSADDVWRPAEVRGEYLPSPVLLRNRPVDGHAGFHVLAPLLVGEGPLTGSVLVVDRGWVPLGEDGGTVDAPALPRGTVDVVVHVRPGEAASERDAPVGQVQAIAPDQVRAAAVGASEALDWPADATLRAYGALVSEDGARPTDVGSLPEPSRDPGSHLSYAFQWWVFALGALGTGVVLVVRGVRERADGLTDAVADDQAAGGTDQPEVGTAVAAVAVGRRPTRTRRRPTAEEEEDALLDAQTDAHSNARTQPPLGSPGPAQRGQEPAGRVRSGSP
ncbi:SURF1 family protein [Actinotalea ferrariae]|uniref:SURF1 family protein n=1 Tax=Actinotalea ferrariae TaxID=1386098 RepID=UPI001C8B5F4D|nr:SURF1 family protein [Actinotalea ferrariae]MBX9244482.1 SURF1 family protein [Actinotalea ferrariae]